MKILKLRMENLASLKGKSEIDFTQKVFTDNGIFLITGATGSGKSTLLDAICLALYHRTPRQKTVSKSINELMTRGTGSCMAEVEFAVGGQGYRASFSQRCARGKSDGALQHPQVELARLDGTVLCSSVNDKLAEVVRITGLDFGRFTRSMLLAQGDFATFLTAKPADTAALLEELTGTEIYAKLSAAAYARAQKSAQALRSLQDRLQGIQLLNTDERMALEAAVAVQKLEHSRLDAELTLAQKQWNAQQDVVRLTGQLAALQLDWQQFNRQRLLQQPDIARLALAERAAPVQVLQQRMLEQKARHQILLTRIQGQRQQQDELRRAVSDEYVLLKGRQSVADQQMQAFRVLEQLVNDEVKPLDREIQRGREDLVRQQQQHATTELALKQHNDKLGNMEARQQAVSARISEAELDLQQRSGEAQWLADWPEMEELQRNCLKLDAEASRVQTDSAKLQLAAGRAATQQALIQTGIAALQQELVKAEQTHTRSVQERELLLVGGKAGDLQASLQRSQLRLKQLQQLADLQQANRQTGQQLSERESESVALTQAKTTITVALRATELQVQQAGATLADKRLILAQQQRIASLETLREQLVDGQACPLCGAEEHPWALSHPVLEADAANREVKEAELHLLTCENQAGQQKAELVKQETRLESLQQDSIRVQHELNQLQTKFMKLAQEAGVSFMVADVDACQRDIEQTDKTVRQTQNSMTRLAELDQALQAALQQMNGLQKQQAAQQIAARDNELALTRDQSLINQNNATLQRLQDEKHELSASLSRLIGVDYVAENADAPSRARALSSVQDAIARYRQLLTQLESDRSESGTLAAEVRGMKATREVLQTQQAQARQLLDTLQAALQEQTQRRTTLLPESADADAWLLQHRLALQSLQAEVQAKQQQLQARQGLLAKGDGEIGQMVQSAEQEATLVHQADSAFGTALQEAGFLSLQAFADALVAETELMHLRELAQQLKDQEQSLQTRLGAKQSELDQARTRLQPGVSSESLENRLGELQKAIENCIRSMASDQQRLQTDDEARQKNQSLLDQLNKATEAHRWLDTLNGLIGSATGDKFRRFAQGLTLDNLLTLANQRLAHLFGRYVLQRKKDEELALQIVDSWQGDATRDTTTLSGGESFLVSLALALGLSDLVSERSIDSLFLDEGFGTLDADTLEIALTALDQLNASGKMIGVISHVEALKERIAVQIKTISVRGGGESRLQLPTAIV
jgi:exonuclease SbcC